MYFGSNADPGNTDETAKLPSAVARVWRWTGDDAVRDEMYDFAVANLRFIFRELDADGDGNVERPGMGPEKLDNTVYAIRGLFDLADMAEAKGDEATRAWALAKGRELERRFVAAWWMPGVPQHADSLGEDGARAPAAPLDRGHPDGGRAGAARRGAGRRVARRRRAGTHRPSSPGLRRRAASQTSTSPRTRGGGCVIETATCESIRTRLRRSSTTVACSTAVAGSRRPTGYRPPSRSAVLIASRRLCPVSRHSTWRPTRWLICTVPQST